MNGWRQALADFPRWLFCGTLCYAPWAYGCTEPIGIRGLEKLLALTLGSWLLVLVCRRQWPAVPLAVAAPAAILLALGWVISLNARSLYDPTYFVFVLRPGWRPGWPGTVEGALSAGWMCRASFLLGALLFVTDLARRPVWKLRLWQTMAVAGSSIALCGLLEKVCRVPTILWGPFEANTTFFATYYYHANAGAFLNLVLPLVAGLTLRAIGKTNRFGERSFWVSALITVLAAEAVNTSRLGQLIAVLLCLGFAAWPARSWLRQAWRLDRKITAGFLIVALLGGAFLVSSIGLAQPLAHWRRDTPESALGRWLADGAGWRAVPDAGWLGFGPNVFRVIFPYYTGYLGRRIVGLWEYQHQDYLQTVLEWGVLGAALWSFLLFGGMVVAGRAYRRNSPGWSRREKLLLPGAMLAVAGVSLHAAGDFPLQIASIQLYALTCLGLCWSSAGWTTNHTGGTRLRQAPDLDGESAG